MYGQKFIQAASWDGKETGGDVMELAIEQAMDFFDNAKNIELLSVQMLFWCFFVVKLNGHS